jgi:hypothetical protein
MRNTDDYNNAGIIEELENQIERLKAEAERRDEAMRQEIANAERRTDEVREAYRERYATNTERWQAEVNAKQERLDALLATDQGEAYAEIEQMKRQVEAWKAQAERAEERTTRAEADKAEALASVAGGDNIHPDDPRVLHIWEKAHRIATGAGFCSEYDRIAEALGVPDLEQDYEGYAEVHFSGTVSVPISGRASRREIADGEVHADLDRSDIIEAIDTYDMDFSIETIEIEPSE